MIPVVCPCILSCDASNPFSYAVFNHMDLSTFENKTFTQGQRYKMHEFHREFRALSKPCSRKLLKFGFDIQF